MSEPLAAIIQRLEDRTLLAAPVAYDQSESTVHDQPLFGSVYASDADFDPLTFYLDSAPTNGTLYDVYGTPLSAGTSFDASFDYVPSGGFTGGDSFTWHAFDGTSNSNVATVSINVTNIAPVAYDQSQSTVHGQPLFGSVYASDDDFDPLTFYLDSAPANGTLYDAYGTPLSAGASFDGSFNYVPSGTFTGSDSFTWHASDGVDDSNVATVTIDVTNNAPVAYDQTESTPAAQPIFGSVFADDDDFDPLMFSLAFGPSNGALDFQANGVFTYTPNWGFSGSDAFTWWANDGVDDSNLATVTIDVTHTTPVFSPDFYNFNIDETVPIGTVVGSVTASDADGQSVAYSLDDGSGSPVPFAIDANGQITTTDEFDYEVVSYWPLTAYATDPDGNSGYASVSVNINDVNEIPVFSEQFYSFSVDENVPVGTVVGSVSASSPLGRALTYWLDDDSVGLGGPFDVDQATGAITTTRALDYETTPYYTLSISADDYQFSEASTSVSITIGDIDENPVLDQPSYSFSVDENVPVGTVLGTLTGTDPQGDPLTFYLDDGADNALFAVDEVTGDITLAHPLDYESQSSYFLTGYAEDPDGNSGSAPIDVTVTDVADDPVFDNPPYAFSMNEHDPAGTSIGTVTATDPQALAITYSLEQTDGNAAFAIDPVTGDITVDVPMDYMETPTLNATVFATNANGVVTTVPVTVDVIDFDETPNGNDAPALSSVAFTVTEYNNGYATGDLTATITDDHVLDNGLFELEVDIDNDGFVDWVDYGPSVMTDFSSLGDMTYGSHNVAVRLTEYEAETGTVIPGDWTVATINVDPAPNNAPTITNLAFELADGFGWDHTDARGFFTGTIDDDTRNFGSYTIQVDTNGDGFADHTSAGGVFDINSTSFSDDVIADIGSNTYAARVVEYDSNSGQTLTGAWASLTFNVSEPANQTPTIDFVEFAGVDNGMGYLDGEFYGEAFDDHLVGSSFDVEIDWDGDLGHADFTITTSQPGSFGGYLSAVPANQPLQARIVEHDYAYNRTLESAWVAVVAPPNPHNRAPKFTQSSLYITVDAGSLMNNQSVGSVTATDLDGDPRTYKGYDEMQVNVGEFSVTVPLKNVKVNADGTVVVLNKDALAAHLELFGNYPIKVEADDGTTITSATAYIVYNPTVLMSKINDHIINWHTENNKVSDLTYDHALAALTDVKGWYKGALGEFQGNWSNLTNATWALSPLTGGASTAVGAGAVAWQTVINGVSNHGAKKYDAIFKNASSQMLAVKTQDYKRWKEINSQEQKGKYKLQNELAHITNPVDKAQTAVFYLTALRMRLPIPEVDAVPTTDEIEGEMLIKIVNIKGWTMTGNANNLIFRGGYYQTNDAHHFFSLDAHQVKRKLNTLQYFKDYYKNKNGWVSDAGDWSYRRG